MGKYSCKSTNRINGRKMFASLKSTALNKNLEIQLAGNRFSAKI
jgi:hypothetical protein